MNDNLTKVVLPVFPEGNQPPRRRSPWWKRVFRLVVAGDSRLIGGAVDVVEWLLRFVRVEVGAYLGKRPWRRLFYGLPALAALGSAGVLALVLIHDSRLDRAQAYRERAKQARENKNFELAKICCLRLTRHDNPQPVDLFDLYQICCELKQEDQADALLSQLTSLDGTSYPPAQVLRARRLLTQAKITPQELAAAERHLLVALKFHPDLLEAHALLGQLYFQMQRWKNAAEHLARAEPADRSLARLLIIAAIAQGNLKDSQLWARRSEEWYRKRVEVEPTNVALRLALAETLLHLQNYPAAIAVLEQGVHLQPQVEYRQALGQAYALQLQILTRDKTSIYTAAHWHLLEKGLRADPNNVTLLHFLLAITNGQDALAEQGRERLRELLAQGSSSAILHLTLGMDAYARQKPEQARIHWERALDLDPRLYIAANNVAWLLAHEEPVDLQRALDLIDSVLKQVPTNASFRETRGQILVKLARWKEGVSDLEYALPYLKNKGPIHGALATAYQQLGLAEVSEQHRRLESR